MNFFFPVDKKLTKVDTDVIGKEGEVDHARGAEVTEHEKRGIETRRNHRTKSTRVTRTQTKGDILCGTIFSSLHYQNLFDILNFRGIVKSIGKLRIFIGRTKFYLTLDFSKNVMSSRFW